jgi:hypothetical protein
MKNRYYPVLGLIALGCLTTARADQVLLSDDFSGTTLNTLLWTTILPFSQSSVVQDNGLTTTGRGILVTAGQAPASYEITGDFTMLNDDEHFNIDFRSNLTPETDTPYYELEGIYVQFSNDGDQISIQEVTPTQFIFLAETNYTLTTGTDYSFAITDDGYNITLAVDGVDLLTASSSYDPGANIAFYSREFPDTGTEIHDITISSVPDSGLGLWTVAATFIGLCGLAFLRRSVGRDQKVA